MTIQTAKFDSLTPDLLYQILKLRETVFVLEQECLYQDMDEVDRRALHSYGMAGDKVIAYARIYWKDKERKVVQIGRVVADPAYRRQKKASSIMKTAIRVAMNDMKAHIIYLEAQTYAIPFYEQLGFKVTSEEFLEDGIPHVQMTLAIDKEDCFSQ